MEAPTSGEADQPSSPAGPKIGAAQVAGVALSYRYGFRLPIDRLAKVQEQHAAQCEALTPVRCRVTGMTYQAGQNRMINASLELKLAPEIARRFGKQSVDAVMAQGGMLADASIESEEVGSTVANVDRDVSAIKSEQAEIAAQLAKPGLGGNERMQLQARMLGLSDAQRASRGMRADAAVKLARTPMRFDYVSGGVDPGFSDGPILGAVKDGWANIISGLATMLMLVISLSPWVAGILLIVWLWRRFGARLGLRDNPNED